MASHGEDIAPSFRYSSVLPIEPPLTADAAFCDQVTHALRLLDALQRGDAGELLAHFMLMSCAAETIMLALSGYQSSHLCGRLEIKTIEDIGRQAETFGFSVVD
jgi:hypothetical protein